VILQFAACLRSIRCQCSASDYYSKAFEVPESPSFKRLFNKGSNRLFIDCSSFPFATGLASRDHLEADLCQAPVLLAAENVRRVKGSGNTIRFESLYMRNQLEGKTADRLKCKFVHANILSVRVVRKAETFASGSVYAGPGFGPHLRRQCCRYAFTDGSRTILNVGLSTCLAGQSLMQEPDRWASPL
jgi:hypothetical protein